MSKLQVLTQVQFGPCIPKAFVDSGADGAAVTLLCAPPDGLFASRRQWG